MGEPLRTQVPQDEGLRRIFASDVRALLSVAAESDARFISHSLETQTDVLKHMDLASGGFIPLLLGLEDPYVFAQRAQMQDDVLNLLEDDDDLNDDNNIEKEVSDPHPGFCEGGKPENLSQGGSEGGGGGSKVVCTYVGTAEVYLVIRLYSMFMSKLQTAWKLCQGAKHRQDSLISDPHKAILSHANAIQFSTETETETAKNLSSSVVGDNTMELFTLYHAFLGLVGAWLGRIISQGKYEESIRQLMGNDSYKFLCLDKLASKLLLHLSRTASKRALINKFGSLARYERLKLMEFGIPLTWNRTISRARNIVKPFPSYFSVHGLYVMMMRQNGTLDFRHVTPQVPAKEADEQKITPGETSLSSSK